MMAVKKTETQKELTKALADIQGMKQEREKLKQQIQKLDNERVDDAKLIEFQIKEIIRLKDLVTHEKNALVKSNNEKESLKISLETSKTYRNELAVKYELEKKEQQEIINTLKGYKEFSATLENDVRMMSKAIVKIMMGVERDG